MRFACALSVLLLGCAGNSPQPMDAAASTEASIDLVESDADSAIFDTPMCLPMGAGCADPMLCCSGVCRTTLGQSGRWCN